MKRCSLLTIVVAALLPWVGSGAIAGSAAKSPPAQAAKKPSAIQVAPGYHRATIISLKKALRAGVPPAPPVDPARLAAARPLVQAVGLREKALAAIERAVPMMTKTIKFRNPKLTDAEMKKVPDRIRANAHATLGQLLEFQAHIYAKHFTVDQIKAITAFYRSDAGKRLLAEETTINTEMGPAKAGWTYGYLVATNKQMGGKPLQTGMVVDVRRNPPPSPAPKPH